MAQRIWKILLAIGILGLVISFQPLLGFLATQPFYVTFAVWYVILFAFIVGIQVTILPGHKFNLRQAIGFIVLYFGIAPVLGFVDNPFISQGLTGATITAIESGPEETLLTYFWIVFTQNQTALLYLVYVVSPVLLTLAAFYILTPKLFDRLFNRLALP